MNIFAVNPSPIISAQQLPDKHVVKMPLECAQMAAMVFSEFKWDLGTLPKKDGTPFKVTKNMAHLKHPCTLWAANSTANMAWLLYHGLSLCDEYTVRYGKIHACQHALMIAGDMFFQKSKLILTEHYSNVQIHVRCMPDYIKEDTTIDDYTAYKLFINTKQWAYDNYLRIPKRRPNWLLKTLP